MSGKLPNIEYTTYPGLDQPLFRCPLLQARLPVKACADRHVRAQATGKDAEAVQCCRDCAIGAGHAGRDLLHRSWLFGLSICPRCGQGTTRMIHNRLCVSCQNRQYEWMRGTNAKGAPVNPGKPLLPLTLAYEADGKPAEYRARMSTGLQELVAQVMRIVPGRLSFKRRPYQASLKQGRLF